MVYGRYGRVVGSIMRELKVFVKQLEGTNQCEIGVWGDTDGEGTDSENGIISALTHGMQVVLGEMDHIGKTLTALDLDDAKSALAERVRERFRRER